MQHDILNILKKYSSYDEKKHKYEKLNSRDAIIEIFDILPNEDESIDKKILQ